MAFDTSKETIGVAIAPGGRRGEVRFFGSIANRAEAVRKLVDKLAKRHERLAFCYEAGPTGYGLYRQLRTLGHECHVVAPSMVPVRPGGQIKTDRLDAVALAALFRAGELTAVWDHSTFSKNRDRLLAGDIVPTRTRTRTGARGQRSATSSAFSETPPSNVAMMV